MIDYISKENILKYVTKEIPQNGGIIEEQINIDNYNNQYKYYLEFKCPQDDKYISSEIEFSGNKGVIKLSNLISKKIGKVFAQLIIRDSNGYIVEKSILLKQPLYCVSKSINAEEKLGTEKAQDLIGNLINLVQEIKQENQHIVSQINQKANIIEVNKINDLLTKQSKLINTKSQIDLLWEGVLRIKDSKIELENIDSYEYLLFVGKNTGGFYDLTAMYFPERKNGYVIGCSAGELIAQWGFCQFVLTINNNTFVLKGFGYWMVMDNKIVYVDKVSEYYIEKVYGVKRGV